MRKRKTEQDYIDLATEKGYEYLGPFPENTHIKTNWKCSKGHIWSSRYDNIRTGYGCPECAKESRRKIHQMKESDYCEFAKERNLTFIGPLPNNSREKTSFLCNVCGFVFSTTHSSLSNSNGRGCPICAGVARKTKADYHLLAKEKGIEWFGKKVPPNNHTKTQWRCPKGHRWKSSYKIISQSPQGCPRCMSIYNGKKASSQQIAIAEMVDGILNYEQDGMFIDVALVDNQIAIEYDSWCFHGETIEKDLVRVNTLISLGWKVITIRSNTLVPERKLVYEAMIRMNKEKHVIVELDDWGQGKTFRN